MTKKRKFEYQPRTEEDIERRANQGGNSFDSPVKEKPFVPSEPKDYLIRVLPPTWEQAHHFGYDVYIHYQVGPDNGQYICPQSMNEGPCPICEERSKADREGETDYASELRPTKRVAAYIIDREDEESGPQVFLMPSTVDSGITKQMKDKFSGEVLLIDHPDEGYDVSFTREGQGINTKYTGFQVARKATPISKDDEKYDAWLDHITENPIPDQLNIYDYEHIARVFGGSESTGSDAPSKPSRSEDDDDDEPPFEPDDKEDDDLESEEDEEEEKPRRRRRRTAGASEKMKEAADD